MRSRKGDLGLVNEVNKWLCQVEESGFMAKAYQETEGTPLPTMPACSQQVTLECSPSVSVLGADADGGHE